MRSYIVSFLSLIPALLISTAGYSDDNPLQLITGTTEISAAIDPRAVTVISETMARFPGLLTAIPGSATETLAGVSYATGGLLHYFSQGVRSLMTGNTEGNTVNWFGRDEAVEMAQIGQGFINFGLQMQVAVDHPFGWWGPAPIFCEYRCR